MSRQEIEDACAEIRAVEAEQAKKREDALLCVYCEKWVMRNFQVDMIHHHYESSWDMRIFQYCPDCGRMLRNVTSDFGRSYF